jgi:hypothetical protein
MALRRARGIVLRLVRRRRLAVTLGAVLAVPALWLELTGSSPAWWVAGLALIVAATGVALVCAGLGTAE